MFGTSTDPCGADPLIFLRYNAFTGLTNAVSAPGSHQLQVSAYYQAASPPAAITSLKLSISTDNGATWQQATVHRDSDGVYTVTYQVPAVTATSGTVAIKAQATDSAGDTVNQTIYNAYHLTAAAGGGKAAR